MNNKLVMTLCVITACTLYVGGFYTLYTHDRDRPCNDIITLTDGTIIKCKNFSVHRMVLSYRDCDDNRIKVPLVNIKEMKRIDEE